MPRVSYGKAIDDHHHAWAVQQFADYLDSGGVKGHISDLSYIGGAYRFQTMLLLRYTGRKSGRTMMICLAYCQFGPEIAIVASIGGSDYHPQWYYNVTADGPLAFQVGTQAFLATAREPLGEEREEAWRWIIRANPLFGDYRKATTREIPVILLSPGAEIPVFTRAEIGEGCSQTGFKQP